MDHNSQRLVSAFREVGSKHREAIVTRAARVTLGGSVLRVFAPKTKDALFPVLKNIAPDRLPGLANEVAYRRWFNLQLRKVAAAILKTNPKSSRSRVHPGYKWGHATKVLSLFVREVVLNSRYFKEGEVKRIQRWLFVPLDSVVMKGLVDQGMVLDFKRIKDIDTSSKFYDAQEVIGRAAREAHIPAIWFDDVWGNRDTGQD